MLLIFCNAAVAQTAGTIAPSSMPDHLTVVGDKLFFSADDGYHGVEVWVTDGEPSHARLVSDIWPGSKGSNPENFHAAAGKLLFMANTPSDVTADKSLGSELWSTDGTTETTTFLLDFLQGVTSSHVVWLTQHNGVEYFDAPSFSYGRELWKTDGTAQGTAMVSDIEPGRDDSAPAQGSGAELPDGRFFFTAFSGKLTHLFVSDGTAQGTKSMAVVALGTRIEIAYKNWILFVSNDEQHGWELWISDGTAIGTKILKDIAPGRASSSPGRFIRFGEVILFSASDPEHGEELWKTDGTPDGTVLLKDLDPGVASAMPYRYTSAGSYVFFVAVAPQQGRELWRTDGTPEGTIVLRDINPGPAESSPYAFCALGDTLLFSALDDEHGEELWRSDGTPKGTRLVKDIDPGSDDKAPRSSFPDKTVTFNGKAYFRATTPDFGCELWCSDGTENGTVMADDIWQGYANSPSSSPHALTAIGDKLFFVATDFEHGNELYVAGNDTTGVRLVRDIFPGVASSDPHDLIAAGNVLYFGADDGTNGDELWHSDGTAEGTAIVQDFAQGKLNAHPHNFVVAYPGLTFFVAWRPEDGNELRALDGGGIRTVLDIAPGGASSNPADLVMLDGKLYFRANDGSHGDELWVTEGYDKTTRMIYDLMPKTNISANPRWLTPLGDVLYFAANDSDHGTELWCLPPGPAYPRLKADIARPQVPVRARH